MSVNEYFVIRKGCKGWMVCSKQQASNSPRFIGFLGIYWIQGQYLLKTFIILSSTAKCCVIPIAAAHARRSILSNQLNFGQPGADPRGAKDKLAAICVYRFDFMLERIVSSPKPSCWLQKCATLLRPRVPILNDIPIHTSSSATVSVTHPFILCSRILPGTCSV